MLIWTELMRWFTLSWVLLCGISLAMVLHHCGRSWRSPFIPCLVSGVYIYLAVNEHLFPWSALGWMIGWFSGPAHGVPRVLGVSAALEDGRSILKCSVPAVADLVPRSGRHQFQCCGLVAVQLIQDFQT